MGSLWRGTFREQIPEGKVSEWGLGESVEEEKRKPRPPEEGV